MFYKGQNISQVDLKDENQASVMEQLKELLHWLQKELNNPEYIFVTRAILNALTDEMRDMTKRENVDFGYHGYAGSCGIIYAIRY